MTESELMREILKIAPEYGARLFRNNVGVLEWAKGKRLRYGLCNGSSDLIGWDRRGRFLAVEVKTERGKVTSEQKNFLTQVNLSGGIGVVVRRLDSFRTTMQATL